MKTEHDLLVDQLCKQKVARHKAGLETEVWFDTANEIICLDQDIPSFELQAKVALITKRANGRHAIELEAKLASLCARREILGSMLKDLETLKG